uniref:Uncharacterized protein n=1 Tax=Plectus sambesii TaxID=2011161 RepID=A0A914UJX3_9BILA
MKIAIIFALFAAAVAQPMPPGSPPCPSGVDASKCQQFFDCMMTQPMPPPPPQPVQGQAPPTPSPAVMAQIENSEKTCYKQAGMTAAEQETMIKSKSTPQGPPCPSSVNTTKCKQFFDCLMSQPMLPPPSPPAQGQSPPTPSPAVIAQIENSEKVCYKQAGMTAAEQDTMIKNRPKLSQGPPPMNGQNGQRG